MLSLPSPHPPSLPPPLSPSLPLSLLSLSLSLSLPASLSILLSLSLSLPLLPSPSPYPLPSPSPRLSAVLWCPLPDVPSTVVSLDGVAITDAANFTIHSTVSLACNETRLAYADLSREQNVTCMFHGGVERNATTPTWDTCSGEGVT